jgi:hypothetical protein
MLLLNLANNLDLPRNSWLLGWRGDWGDLVSEAGGFPLELLDL